MIENCFLFYDCRKWEMSQPTQLDERQVNTLFSNVFFFSFIQLFYFFISFFLSILFAIFWC